MRAVFCKRLIRLIGGRNGVFPEGHDRLARAPGYRESGVDGLFVSLALPAILLQHPLFHILPVGMGLVGMQTM